MWQILNYPSIKHVYRENNSSADGLSKKGYQCWFWTYEYTAVQGWTTDKEFYYPNSLMDTVFWDSDFGTAFILIYPVHFFVFFVYITPSYRLIYLLLVYHTNRYLEVFHIYTGWSGVDHTVSSLKWLSWSVWTFRFMYAVLHQASLLCIYTVRFFSSSGESVIFTCIHCEAVSSTMFCPGEPVLYQLLAPTC